MIERFGLGVRIVAAAVFIVAVGAKLTGCYAHTGGPVPNCAVDPHNPACLPPLTDQHKKS